MIDRFNERKFIKDAYEKKKGQSVALIMFAYTGVGKSFLSDSVFLKVKDAIYLRVKVNKKEAEEDNGIFFPHLAQALNTSANETLRFLNLNEFIKSAHKPKNKEVINDIIDIMMDVAKIKEVKSKVDKYINFTNKIVERILQENNNPSIVFLFEYIKYISLNNQIIISIDNAHLSNTKFILFLSELLKNTDNLFIICEFTIKESEDEVVEFFQHFDSNKLITMEINKLPKSEILGALKHITDNKLLDEIYSIIENSYHRSRGNLRFLQWLLKKNKNWNLKGQDLANIMYDDVFHFIYKTFSNDQKLILWHVVAHNGNVNIKTYQKLARKHKKDWISIEKDIAYIEELDLIDCKEDVISVVHDSLFELLIGENDHFDYMTKANIDWFSFYRILIVDDQQVKLGKSNMERYDLLVMQLNFIINIGGNDNIRWMNFILSEIDKSLNTTASISLISKLTKIIYSIVENSNNKSLISKTYEWIIMILYKLGYSREIYNIMSQLNIEKPSNLLFLMQCSARISICDKTVIENLQEAKKSHDEFLKIGAQLLLIRYYRTFNQINKAKLIWKKLKKQYKKSNYINVIYEYVNVSSFSVNKRLRYLKKAQKGYETEKNYYHLCSVYLSITTNLFYLYFWKLIPKKLFLKISNNYLDKTKELLPHCHYPFHIYANQKNVVNLIEGKISTKIIKNNFQLAYLNCGIVGNKSLISSNIIAAALKQNDFSGIDDYVAELVETSKTYRAINSEFSRYPLINCYYYYRKVGEKIKKHEVIRLLFYKKTFYQKKDYFFKNLGLLAFMFLHINYYPTNIINWDIDFQNLRDKALK